MPRYKRKKQTTKNANLKSKGRQIDSEVRSGFESKIKQNLILGNKEFGYETEVLSYVTPEVKRRYTPDFVITTDKGTKVYVEAKGYFDAQAQRKMNLVVQQNPDLDIRMLFMSARKLVRKGAKLTYAGWAEKRNIPWAEGTEIPEDWWTA